MRIFSFIIILGVSSESGTYEIDVLTSFRNNIRLFTVSLYLGLCKTFDRFFANSYNESLKISEG